MWVRIPLSVQKIMKMNNIILLDLDGVLITTVPWEVDKMR
jgi:histidinol phosphatase-like enzyme